MEKMIDCLSKKYFNMVKKNAIAVAPRDDYKQLILCDGYGYSFTRDYGQKLWPSEEVVGTVTPYWENEILKARYERVCLSEEKPRVSFQHRY